MNDAAAETTCTEVPAPSARALLKRLQQEFPVIGEHKPLAIGIDKQLLQKQPDINRKQMRIALGIHTHSIRYLKSLQAGKERFNLDGSPAGEVSEEQRSVAAKDLMERLKKRAQEHKAARIAKEKAEREARAEQEKQEKLLALAQKFAKR